MRKSQRPCLKQTHLRHESSHGFAANSLCFGVRRGRTGSDERDSA
jgi:hypothetical protein